MIVAAAAIMAVIAVVVVAMVMIATAIVVVITRRTFSVLTRNGLFELVAAAGATRAMLFSLDSALMHHLDELYFEGKRFASKRVIMVEMHDAIFNLNAGNLDLLAGLSAQHDGLTNGNLLPVGHEVAGNLLDKVTAPFPIGFSGLKTDRTALTLLHLEDSLVETGNHLAGAYGKLNGLAAFIAVVKLGSVIKHAHVVDAHLLTNRNHELTFPTVRMMRDRGLGASVHAKTRSTQSALFEASASYYEISPKFLKFAQRTMRSSEAKVAIRLLYEARIMQAKALC